jgi:hypothetical protein
LYARWLLDKFCAGYDSASQGRRWDGGANLQPSFIA